MAKTVVMSMETLFDENVETNYDASILSKLVKEQNVPYSEQDKGISMKDMFN